MRNAQRSVTYIPRLFAEYGAEQALLGSKLCLALGGNLADKDISGTNLRAGSDDAALVQLGKSVLADVGDVTGDFLRPQLGVTSLKLMLLDVDGGVGIVLYELLGYEYRVLVVVALPRHEANENVPAECDFSALGGSAVGYDVALDNTLTLGYERPLMQAGTLVAALELQKLILVLYARVAGHDNPCGGHIGDRAFLLDQYDYARVESRLKLHTRRHNGRFRAKQRHGLTLHVRAHQSAVRVVVLKEGNHRGRDGDKLLWGYVDVVDLLGGNLDDLVLKPCHEVRPCEPMGLGVDRLVRLSYNLAVLLVRRKVDDFVGDYVVLLVDYAVRSFDEAVFVDARIGRKGVDKAYVGAFRGLNGTHSAIVGVVNVTHLEGGAVTIQAAGAECGKPALVCKLGQGVGLIHEL